MFISFKKLSAFLFRQLGNAFKIQMKMRIYAWRERGTKRQRDVAAIEQVLHIHTHMQPQQQFAIAFVIVLVCCCTHKQKPATDNSLEKQLNVASAMKLENCNKNHCTGDKQNKNKVCGFPGQVSVCWDSRRW